MPPSRCCAATRDRKSRDTTPCSPRTGSSTARARPRDCSPRSRRSGRAPRPADLRAPERKDLEDFDSAYNPKIPKREILGLSTLAFIEAREDALLMGPPGLGKSHIAKSLTQLAVQRGYKVLYREAHVLIDDIHQARELGALLKYRSRRLPRDRRSVPVQAPRNRGRPAGRRAN
jgi:hypothetical protein